MSLWGRIFAAGYDTFMTGPEKAVLRDHRRALLGRVSQSYTEADQERYLLERFPGRIGALLCTLCGLCEGDNCDERGKNRHLDLLEDR